MAGKHILEGYRVLDFTQFLAGPTCTRLMAELGADVIKVELMPNGDPSRSLPFIKNNRSAYYVQQNRGKRSLCIDPKQPEGLAILKRLLAKVDVMIESFSPGVIGRMGLGWEVVRDINPRAVMCSLSAFGQEGELSDQPGFDFIAAAYAGVLDMIGEPDGPPMFVGLAMGDVNAGVHALAGVSMALLHRHKTGQGQYLDISLLDSYYHMHEINLQAHSGSNGEFIPTRSGSQHATVTPLGVFQGKSKYLFVVILPTQWEKFCTMIGRPDLIEDAEMASNEARCRNQERAVKLVQDWLDKQDSDEQIFAKFKQARLAIAPILSVPETMRHPHFVHRQMVREIDDRGFGTFTIPGDLSGRHPQFPGENFPVVFPQKGGLQWQQVRVIGKPKRHARYSESAKAPVVDLPDHLFSPGNWGCLPERSKGSSGGV